jgi:copper chaperone
MNIAMTTTDTITVDNLKCGGCENTIKIALKKMHGVEKVIINSEASEINIVHDASVTRNMLTRALKSLGYPETGTTEGLDALLTNAKSFVSCATGRMSSVKED